MFECVCFLEGLTIFCFTNIPSLFSQHDSGLLGGIYFITADPLKPHTKSHNQTEESAYQNDQMRSNGYSAEVEVVTVLLWHLPASVMVLDE